MNPLNENTFQKHVADYLAKSELYCKRSSDQFDIERLCDLELLENFLKKQTLAWTKLNRHFPGCETLKVTEEVNRRLNRGESMLTILQKGVNISGAKVKLLQFKPELEGEDSDNYKLYRENRFAVVREMKYSTAGEDKNNRLDLCFLINGLPIITVEMKNEGSGQDYRNGIYQYRFERNAENRMLRNCLVHFVMDNNYVFMTTKLKGEETYFLPFNRETINPPIEGDYPTAYMWREIWQADSLLDLLQNFIKRCNEKGKMVTYFPRFHQLRAVRMLREEVKHDGPGHDYLIQHSAGSGKTKTMAWLAHQLANMTNADNTPIFDSIIMVTDRIVLNRNMADDVLAFETKAGTVKDIRKGSKNLATALNEGYRIIMSTVQKFAYALKTIKHEKAKKYAIIIDEAHTAMGNEATKDIVEALSTDDDLRNAPDFNPEEFEDQVDAMLAYMQVYRRKMSHLSYFAFTATPKDKTYALFGKNGKEPHDLYSMKQAIDEKFILNVIEYYKNYRTMFELIEKNQEDDSKKLFEKKKAMRVIFDFLNHHNYIMLRKANIMVEHFMKSTINKIGHKAKAMVVADSRRAAVEYKLIIDRILQDQYAGKVKTLVAFSGEVKFDDGRKFTESSMNDDNVFDDGIREKFEEDDYKILIVAEKFQTGFDQPLLHTMYVDRLLGDIQCIQTLSRLNRCHPGKEDTMVIDFRNDPEKIKTSFNKYYTKTSLEGEVDAQRLYTMKGDVESWNKFNEDEVNKVVSMFVTRKQVQAIPSILKKIVEDRIEPMEDKDKDVYRRLVGRYVRQYGFFVQFADFTDPDLEKFYVFCKVFYKYLPYTKETLPTEILEKVDLDKLRLQLGFEGNIELEDEEQTLSSPRTGEPGTKLEDEEQTIAEILDLVNSPYKQFLNENDKILKQILDEVMVDPEVTEAFNARNTYEYLVTLVGEKLQDKVYDMTETCNKIADILETNKSFSMTLVGRLVETIAANISSQKNLPYDEEALKEKIVEAMRSEFKDVCSHMRSIEEFVDTVFYVLNTVSITMLDGIDDLLKNALNHLFANEEVTSVEKHQHFNTLVSKFEAYLKKLYFLINNTEIVGRDGKSASLADAIHAFKCLWNLKYDNSDEGKRFSEYLSMLRDLRNDETHVSPYVADAEVDAAIKVVVAMYLYVTGYSITDLEGNGM